MTGQKQHPNSGHSDRSAVSISRRATRSRRRCTTFIVGLVTCVLAGCSGRGIPKPHGGLSIAEVKAASRGERGTVLFQGAATLINANFGYIVVQDETGGVRVSLPEAIDPNLAGHRVEITGHFTPGSDSGSITESTIRDLGRTRLPSAKSVQGNDLRSDRFDDTLVTISGVARAGQIENSGQLELPVNVGGTEVIVRVLEDRAKAADQLTDAEVKLTGVAGTSSDIDGRVTGFTLLMPDLTSVVITRKAPEAGSVPLEKVSKIRAGVSGQFTHKIRLVGSIEKSADSSGFRFADTTGSIRILSSVQSELSESNEKEVTAFVSSSGEGAVLQNLEIVIRTGGTSPLRGASPAAGRIITNAAELRGMTQNEANLAYPVSLEGVVTYRDSGWRLLFFQDRSSGIFVSLHGGTALETGQPGEQVRVTGVSGPGDFAPVVQNPRIERLGTAPMPIPSGIDKEDVFLGRADSQWVELEGIIHQIGKEDQRTFAILSWGPHEYRVLMPATAVIPPEWIDRKVKVQGACGSIFNSRRQLLGVQLFVPTLAQFTLLEAPPAEISATPVSHISKLLEFSPAEIPGHRVHLRGRVAVTHRDGPTWVSDDSGSVMIRDHNGIGLSPGDVVDVAGFAVPGLFSAEVHDAYITKLAKGLPLKPILITADTALADGVHGQLVQIEGRLLSQVGSGQEQILLMREGKAAFNVRGRADLPSYEANSILSIKGICLVKAKRYQSAFVPSGFEILVDSPSSITVVRPAPWLTQELTFRAFGITALAIMVVLAWVIVLRRRVEAQTGTIAQKLSEVESLRVKAEAASELKSQFLANMSHEIRTPMNGILGMAELARQAASVEEQRECLEVIRSSGDALLAIINDLLDISKIESGKFELDVAPFSFRQLLSDSARVFVLRVQEKGLRLESSVGESCPEYLLGDALRLRQVLLNLLANAVKFTDEGSIVISAEFHRELPMKGLHISLKDSGIGIPADQQERIFESFRQADGSTARKYGGTGLGLSICRNLLSLMGGRISVESEVGRGSTFHLWIPLKISEIEPRRLPEPPDGVARAHVERSAFRILLAEDNPVNQTLAIRLLNKQGHEVIVAGNGKLAIEAFAGGSFDLILMDVHMPEMDGLEATECIRRMEGNSGNRIPIVAMTALNMKGDREKCLASGMDAFISKPIRLPELFAAIEEVTRLSATLADKNS